jgi:hypothetical protein
MAPVPSGVVWDRVVRVAIDLTPLQRRVTGCDRYLLELIGALAELDEESDYILFVNRGDGARWGPLPRNFRTVVLPLRSCVARLAFQQAVLPLWLRHLGVHVLHSPSFFTPLVPTRARHVLTVHDLTTAPPIAAACGFSRCAARIRSHQSGATTP